MSRRRRSSRSHRGAESRGKMVRGRAFRMRALVLGALCLWATVPFGSVAIWARSVIVVACLALSMPAYLISRLEMRRLPDGEFADKHHSGMLLACVGAWILVQLIPLPVAVLSRLQPMGAAGYRMLFENAAWTSISFDPFLSRHTAVLWIAYCLFAWSCARLVRSKNDVRSVAYVLVGIGTIQAVAGIVLHGSPLWNSGQFGAVRFCGTFSSGNSFGGFVVMTSLVSLGLLISVASRVFMGLDGRALASALLMPRRRRDLTISIVLLLSLMVQIVALIFSGSKGATIAGALCAVSLIIWFAVASEKGARRSVMAVVLALAVVVAFLGIGGAYTVLSGRFESLLQSETAAEVPRLVIWGGALRMLVTHPLGVGAGCFGEAFARFQPMGFGPSRVYHAHNDYLEILCELGIAGVFVAVAAFWILFLRIRPLVVDRSGHDHVWIWRGALAAVAAGMLHATVDYNLSSRPGVAVTFFLLLGVVIGFSSRHSRKRAETEGSPNSVRAVPYIAELSIDSSVVYSEGGTSDHATEVIESAASLDDSAPRATGRRFRPIWNIGILGSLFVVLSIGAVRCGKASWTMEAGWQALGGIPDKYFWLSDPMVTPGNGTAFLQRARDVLRRYGWAHYLCGIGEVLEAGVSREEVVRENLAEMPDMDVTRLRGAVRAAMMSEEIEANVRATAHFNRAVELSPWSPDIRGRLCRSLAMALLTEDGDESSRRYRQVLSEARKAVWLAPNDGLTLTHACFALGYCISELDDDDEARAGLRATLLEWGRHALSLRSGINDDILRSWDRAGIDLNQVLDEGGFPPDVVWKAYLMSDAEGSVEKSLKCLQILDRACADPAYTESVFRRKATRQRIEDIRVSGLREKAGWLLRSGRWNEYRMFREQRLEAHASISATGINDVTVSEDVRYLDLRSRNSKQGLDTRDTLDLCRMEVDRGNAALASVMLAELALTENRNGVRHLKELPNADMGLPEKDPGMCLARARVLMERGEYRLAENELMALKLDELSRMFRHRARLMLARCVQARGDVRATRKLLQRAALECPTDPDVIKLLLTCGGTGLPVRGADGGETRPVVLLSSLIPAYGVGMSFLGGRVELVGFDIQLTGQGRGGDLAMRLFWRFWGSVPSDLTSVVTTTDARGSGMFAHHKTFHEMNSMAFVSGRPSVGSMIVQRITMPWLSLSGSRLSVGLRAGSPQRLIRSVEGLRRMEIRGWGEYVRTSLRLAGPMIGGLRLEAEGVEPPMVTRLGKLLDEVWARCYGDFIRESPRRTERPLVRLVRCDVEEVTGFDLRNLGDDGFMIRVNWDGVHIFASHLSGLEYGLNRFLADTFGYRWFLPDTRFRVFPRHERLFVSPMLEIDAPAASLRYFSRASSRKPGQGWAISSGLSINDTSPAISFSHNMHAIFDPTMYYESNRGWYPMHGGVRLCPTNQSWQVCLSADGVVDRAVAAAHEFFEQHPKKNMFPLGINDTTRWCECQKCAAMCGDEERLLPANERSWSVPYWTFVNDVARQAKRSFPDKRVGAIAYCAVARPPPFSMESNVTVFQCMDVGGYFDQAYRDRRLSDLKEWSRRVTVLGRYGYPGLASWIFPRYCLDEIARDVQETARVGVEQYYMEDVWPQGIGGALPWVTARLLWDPWADHHALQQQFSYACFGSASRVMVGYFDKLQAVWQDVEEGWWFEGLYDLGAQAARYPEETRKELVSTLQLARKEAAGDQAIISRIDAVAALWVVADAIGLENELMTGLVDLLTQDMTDLSELKRKFAELSAAIDRRKKMLIEQASDPQMDSVRSALARGATLKKWERREETLCLEVQRLITAVEAAGQ